MTMSSKRTWRHLYGEKPHYWERECGKWRILLIGECGAGGWTWRTSCFPIYRNIVLTADTLDAAKTQAAALFQTHLLEALEDMTGMSYEDMLVRER